MMTTRLLDKKDFKQVYRLIKDRPATVIEFKRHPGLVDDEFQKEVVKKWKKHALRFLKGDDHRIYGTFDDDVLVSAVFMHITSEKDWTLINLKTKDKVPLSKNGLKQTMTAMYVAANELNLTTYHCCVAQYRHKNFVALMKRIVPEYFNEYMEEVVEIIPAKAFGQIPFVDISILKYTR